MATLKLVLDQRRKRTDGTYPLVIRLSHQSKTRDLGIGIKLKPTEFNPEKQRITLDPLHDEVHKTLITYKEKVREHLLQNPNSNVSDLKDMLLLRNRKQQTIAEFWQTEIERLISIGRAPGSRSYKMVLSAIRNDINLDVAFDKLTHSHIIELETKLYQRGMSTNGIAVYMRTFRAICNKAINQDLVSLDWYPFRKYKIKKQKTTPRVISLAELRSYFQLNLPKEHQLYESWSIGKLIFMLRGINLRDLLLLSSENFKNGRIIYRRQKTGKVYSVKQADEVISLLKEFSALSMTYNQYQQRRKVINAHLKKIGEMLCFDIPLTTYVFRYSYANVAKQLGYPKDLIAEALGHEYGNSVTGIYLEQYDLELIDSMNEKIIQTVRGGR